MTTYPSDQGGTGWVRPYATPRGRRWSCRLEVTDRHRSLLPRLNQEDREWVARQVAPGFEPSAVSALTLAALPRIRLELLETRIGNRGNREVSDA